MKQTNLIKWAGLWLLVAGLIMSSIGIAKPSKITVDVISKGDLVFFLFKNRYKDKDFQCSAEVIARMKDDEGNVALRTISIWDVTLPAGSLEIKVEAGKDVIAAFRNEMIQPRIVKFVENSRSYECKHIPVCVTADKKVVAEEVKFPSMIKYNILRGGRSIGHALLEFERNTRYGKNNLFSLHLGNFTGVGIQSNQTLHTDVEQETLSLHAAVLCDGKRCTRKNWVYEIRIKDALGMDLSKTKVCAYKERSSDGIIDQVLYSEAKVVDLLSAFLVTSEAVRSAETCDKKINLFVGKSAKLVDLLISKRKERVILSFGKRVNAKAVSIGCYCEVVFKFYIYEDKEKNVYFPIQVDMNVERGLTLKAVKWSSSM
jgi:hypothetical protein